MASVGRGYSTSPLRNAIAGADLSTKQWYFVVAAGATADYNNKVTVAGANANVLGILCNAPSADGKSALVMGPGGRAKLVISETVTPGQMLTSTSAGKGEVADAAAEFVGAIALQYGVVNDIIEVLVVAFDAAASDV